MRSLIRECARDLRQRGHEIAERLELGAMIEVPAAAIALSRHDRKKLDFLAIGTNDLVQYTLAVDRNNDQLDNIYDPLHPAVPTPARQVIATARRAGKPVSLCGEIAGDTAFTPLLVAMGLEEFSMHPGQLLQVRDRLTALDCKALRRAAPKLLRSRTREEVERRLIDTLENPEPCR